MALACSGSLHIEIEQSGVYGLDYKTIAAQQPTLADCRADQLALSHRDGDVPIRVVNWVDSKPDPDARIEWVGHHLRGAESYNDAFSVNNVYLLHAAGEAPARIVDKEPVGSGRASLERTLHLEHDELMMRLDQQQQKPGEEPDFWEWAKLTHVDPEPFSTTFALPDLAASGSDVAMTLNFRGLSSLYIRSSEADKALTDHLVDVTINDKSVGSLGWNGRDEVVKSLRVARSLLKQNGNTLTMRVPKRYVSTDTKNPLVDVVMFNWVEMRFPIAGDLDAGTLALNVESGAKRPMEIAYRGEGLPVLVGDDGVRRAGKRIADGRYQFAAAPVGVAQYPLLDGKLAWPLAIRPVSAMTNWHKPDQAFDYLMVSHRSLIDAARPLAEFHQSRGMKVALVDVDELYDQFNGGIPHPQAIRKFVDVAWHTWPKPRPRFLLLVGKASFDIRHDTYDDTKYAKWTSMELLSPNQFGTIGGTPYANKPKTLAASNLIPTWQYPSPEGQSASDNPYGAVDGDNFYPVVAVGRFPVVRPDEVTAIVNKTIRYMTNPPAGAWRRDVMFITDESEYFKQASDEIATTLNHEGYSISKVYASDKEADNLAHQAEINKGLDDGQLLVHFIGHGGRYIWRTGPPDLRKNHDLFTLDDVANLSNRDRLPMILSMTCYSAPFDNPFEDSIGERFLREPDKGAVAVFAASWRNAPSADFSKKLVNALLTPGATIGESIVKAKKDLGDRVLVEMYNLLGDPAVVLEHSPASLRVERGGDRWNRQILVAMPSRQFDGTVTVDWLDAHGEKLKSVDYHANQSTLSLPIPMFAGSEPTEVRVYASDSGVHRDALGLLRLQPKAPPPVAPVVESVEVRQARKAAGEPAAIPVEKEAAKASPDAGKSDNPE